MVDTISEIMKLGDVPGTDLGLVREKLEQLSQNELEVRLTHLRQLNEKFAKWRQTRGPAPSVNDRNRALLAEMSREHPVLPSGMPLTSSAVTDALARIESVMLKYEPDLIVAVNEESRAIADLLKADLRISANVVTCVGLQTGTLVWSADVATSNHSVVCVVGNVAYSGHTHARVLNEARMRFGTEKVYGAAIAASLEATANTATTCSLVYHHIVGIEAPPRESGDGSELKQKGRRYLIEAAGRTITVHRDALHQARKEMTKYLTDEGEPWKPAVSA